jgi:hypothetical protein
MRGYNSTNAELSESEGRRVRRQLQPGGNEHAAAAKRARSNWAVNQVKKDAKLAQKLGQLQPFVAALAQDRMGQLASFGPT